MNLLKKTITVFIIMACLIGIICPCATLAVGYISDYTVIKLVTSEAEKRKLLGGTTPDEAREEYVLGIASKFAVFVSGEFNHNAGDVGGKAALGGKVVASYNGNQFGCEYYNYQKTSHDGSADLILGGSAYGMWNNNVLATCSATKQGYTYDMPKLIVIPEELERRPSITFFDGPSYTTDDKDFFVRANLIDFYSEFEFLNNGVSKKLASMETTGTIIESEEPIIVTNAEYGNNNVGVQGTIFKGENPFYNIFNVTSDKWNSYKNIMFDVPYDSYVIINIDGDNIVFSDEKSSEDWAYRFSTKNIFYPISRKEILEDGLESKEPAYLIDSNNPIGDTVRDEEGYVKTYIKLLSADEKNWDKGKYILYNLPNATSFTLDGNWVGAILAPNAAGESQYSCGGHLAGNLICGSFDGGQEFGSTLFEMPNSYFELEEVEIANINSISGNLLPGVTMQIRDLKGNVLYRWETTTENKKVKLLRGEKFILEEVDVPEGYTKREPIAFSVGKEGNCVIQSSVNYKEVESVGTTYSNITTSISSYTNKKGINKIEFVPDTSSATTKKDWGLACTVGGCYLTPSTESSLYGYTGIYREDLKWTQTDDGETVTVYFPPHEVADYTKGWLNFYRGGDLVGDVKLKTLTTYQDSATTKITAKNIENVDTVRNIIQFGTTPQTGIKVNINVIEKDSNVKVAGLGIGLYSLEKNNMFEKDELIAGGVTDLNGNLVLERCAIPSGNYYIKEISNPVGYIPLNLNIEYNLGTEILDINLELEKEIIETTVNISKKSKETGEPVEDVVFGVFAKEDIIDEDEEFIYKKDKLVYDKKTGADGTLQMIFSKYGKYLPLGKYYIKEIGGTTGIIYDDNIYEIEITQGKKEYTFDVENDCTKVEILQVDSVEGLPIAGAELQIQNEDGDIVREFVTTEEPYRINSLALGNYKLVEVKPAEGYLPAEPIKFTVKSTEEIQKVKMKSNYTQVEIIKVDTLEGTPVVGSKLQIKNEEGEIVDEWTTGENAFKIDKLPFGKYTLVVVESAENYLMFDNIEFEVTETSGVTTVNVQAEKQTEEDIENEKQDETQIENKNEQINKEDKKESTAEINDKNEQTTQKEEIKQEEKAELKENTNKLANSIETGDKLLSIVISLVVASIALAISVTRIRKK